jgi:Sulfotransferase domain
MPDRNGVAISRPAVPDVIIGGAPRSGTTFLCHLLLKHPDVYVAQPIAPEPKVCLTPHPQGNPGLLERYAQFFANTPVGKLRVEKTTNYFENEAARERLAGLLDDVRFVFILREPVARAYSNWLWSRKNGLETLSFEEAIRLEGNRPSPFPPEREHVRPFDYMIRGRYGTFAENWLKSFGNHRVGFFLFEHALEEPEAFVARFQAYLEIEPLPWSILRTGKINATEPDPAGLDPALAKKLRAYIAPEVDRFAQVTGLDVSVWGY